MDILQILKNIKVDYDTAITTARFNGNRYANGHKAKEALIRSQRIINLIHEFIKKEFEKGGVPAQMIYPPIGHSSPEIKIRGFLKSKNQDVAIIPTTRLIVLTNTISPEVAKVLSVNIRSQLSSLSKNIDTLYERTFAEALNLHLSYPKQCLGEVYLIPTHEYDDKTMVKNKILFKKVSKIEDYIRMFQAINGRRATNKDAYKYERVCLLIADFRQKIPKLYSSIEELKRDGLVPKNTDVSLENLTIENFAEDILSVYKKRFGRGVIL
ncbi:MAG TPA: restriction endonuclease [Candidatus Paceibacterota bacterium]